MRLSVGVFFGGFFAALGVLLFLVAFGTDYWLLATEIGTCSKAPEDAGGEKATFHHEGFFWRCWFSGNVGENNASMWNFWYTNQSPSKNCTHAYLSPFPLIRDEHNSTSYDSAIIYRGFWTVLMLLGVVTIVMASFFIICAAPFASHILYKAGGGFFIIAELEELKIKGKQGMKGRSDEKCTCCLRVCIVKDSCHKQPFTIDK
ncbi:transmembrane protein 182 isoform X2 [Pezoporus wallicus]|uniref:transmembrane protein 182 isoform X2 n=1 Tax=Pezoporus wallicus TaxID=35540 RepID=UPI002550D622|nr:transmembrane protein 182 isoform X2 [Pezoporus wallicus]XP_061315595.1 transmembrane protein 182 isoform X2 [Pezoporus flaviventris]